MHIIEAERDNLALGLVNKLTVCIQLTEIETAQTQKFQTIFLFGMLSL